MNKRGSEHEWTLGEMGRTGRDEMKENYVLKKVFIFAGGLQKRPNDFTNLYQQKQPYSTTGRDASI